MPSYRAVLRTQHAVRTFVPALIGRLSYGVVPLALLFAVIQSTGSYRVAGVFLALFGLISAVLSPWRARLIDRHGPGRALPPMAAVYASALIALTAATWHPGTTPNLLLYGLAAAAGSSTPPLGPIMRTLWSDLLPGQELRQRAFSLDTVAEETLYIAGPLLAGAVAAVANPALGVALGAALILTGSLLLITSPAVRSRRVPVPAALDTSGPAAGLPAVLVLYRPILVSAAAGMCLGSLSLLIVGFARNENQLAAVAWIEAALAVGSVAGGLAYGAITWRMPGSRLLPLLALALGLSIAVAGLSTNLYVLGVLAGVIGLFVSPSLTTAYLLADETATPGTRTQAGAWVNTAFNLAGSAGTAMAGLLLAGFTLPVCFAVAAAPPLIAAVITAVPGRISRRRGAGRTVMR
ncbi:MAG TPA: MFS transporter [Actinoplanes sp.]|nr:MFS transporter [Actinoplanes sp.]